MITLAHAQLMARYNKWQNGNIYGAAETLTDAQRKENRGAFFGSIHGTLCHLVFGDQIWMHRFAATPAPKATTIAESVTAIADWADLRRERVAFDQVIIGWVDGLDPAWLEGTIEWYSGATGRTWTEPRWEIVTHFFNHQTHHRGQVHCLLTQFGVRPGDTDMPFMAA